MFESKRVKDDRHTRRWIVEQANRWMGRQMDRRKRRQMGTGGRQTDGLIYGQTG
jgi:hypothetical protein